MNSLLKSVILIHYLYFHIPWTWLTKLPDKPIHLLLNFNWMKATPGCGSHLIGKFKQQMDFQGSFWLLNQMVSPWWEAFYKAQFWVLKRAKIVFFFFTLFSFIFSLYFFVPSFLLSIYLFVMVAQEKVNLWKYFFKEVDYSFDEFFYIFLT